ncbi:hypothetical protein [Labilibacter marinus]|uniref:hypothetical protein n=1 Tax=Labilibacter marinus TaxID=1477105 RepID=UPI000836FFD3|nr:hypothetical protein [Labilibacter marinus]
MGLLKNSGRNFKLWLLSFVLGLFLTSLTSCTEELQTIKKESEKMELNVSGLGKAEFKEFAEDYMGSSRVGVEVVTVNVTFDNLPNNSTDHKMVILPVEDGVLYYIKKLRFIGKKLGQELAADNGINTVFTDKWYSFPYFYLDSYIRGNRYENGDQQDDMLKNVGLSIDNAIWCEQERPATGRPRNEYNILLEDMVREGVEFSCLSIGNGLHDLWCGGHFEVICYKATRF